MPHEALFTAVATGDLRTVNRELETVQRAHNASRGPAIGSLVNEEGQTLAGCAARHGQVGVLGRLHALGVDLAAQDQHGFSPADYAVHHHQLDVLRALAGMDVSLAIRHDARRPDIGRIKVALYSHPAVQAVLAEVTESPFGARQDHAGGATHVPAAPLPTLSPAELLHSAVGRSQVAMLESLALMGQDLHAPNPEGRIPLEEAARLGHVPVLEFYRARGTDLGGLHGAGGTSLAALAASRGHVEVLDYLAAHGVDLLQPGRDGRTAAHTAIERGDIAVLEGLHRHRNLQEAFPHGDLAQFALRQPEGETVVAWMIWQRMSMPSQAPGMTDAQVRTRVEIAAVRAAQSALHAHPGAETRGYAMDLQCPVLKTPFSSDVNSDRRPVRFIGSDGNIQQVTAQGAAHKMYGHHLHPATGEPIGDGEITRIVQSDAYQHGDRARMAVVRGVESMMMQGCEPGGSQVQGWGSGRPPPDGWGHLLVKAMEAAAARAEATQTAVGSAGSASEGAIATMVARRPRAVMERNVQASSIASPASRSQGSMASALGTPRGGAGARGSMATDVAGPPSRTRHWREVMEPTQSAPPPHSRGPGSAAPSPTQPAGPGR